MAADQRMSLTRYAPYSGPAQRLGAAAPHGDLITPSMPLSRKLQIENAQKTAGQCCLSPRMKPLK
jgi:hypothetical protein